MGKKTKSNQSSNDIFSLLTSMGQSSLPENTTSTETEERQHYRPSAWADRQTLGPFTEDGECICQQASSK